MATNCFKVHPDGSDKVGATPLSKNWRPDVDTAFRDAVKSPPRVIPEEVDVAALRRQMLALLVPHSGARNAYLEAYKRDPARAIEAVIDDLTAYRAKKSRHPYGSVVNRLTKSD